MVKWDKHASLLVEDIDCTICNVIIDYLAQV